jgi:hypothetical protein
MDASPHRAHDSMQIFRHRTQVAVQGMHLYHCGFRISAVIQSIRKICKSTGSNRMDLCHTTPCSQGIGNQPKFCEMDICSMRQYRCAAVAFQRTAQRHHYPAFMNGRALHIPRKHSARSKPAWHYGPVSLHTQPICPIQRTPAAHGKRRPRRLWRSC